MAAQRVSLFFRKHPLARRVLIAALVGLALDLALRLAPLPPLTAVREAADDMADSMMRTAVWFGANPSPRFAFIDIDDATWFAWGAPLVTPRGKVATLIERTASAKPAMIVVDIDLAWRDGADGGDGQLSASEAELARVLAAWPPDAPPLLLVRSLLPHPPPSLPALRPTAFDAAAAKPNLHWALPSFERDADGKLRRWLLVTPYCTAGKPGILPSLQLAAAWIWWTRPGNESPLERALGGAVPASCDGREAAARLSFTAPDGPQVVIDGAETASRVIYAVRWEKGKAGLGPRDVGGGFKIAVRSAQAVERIPAGGGIPGIEGAIAIIGGSFDESGDLHETPIGVMPGAIVLANAIDALIHHGTPKSPPWPLSLALSLVIIALTALAAATLKGPAAAIVAAAGVVALTLFTLPMLRSGYVFTLAAPAVGILLIDTVRSLWEAAAALRKQGWSWFLKSPPDKEPQK
jgi:CHASE2 domain-containing sensor protein